jgi:hypothetical protein
LAGRNSVFTTIRILLHFLFFRRERSIEELPFGRNAFIVAMTLGTIPWGFAG